MKKRNKWIISTASALAFMLGASWSSATTTTFGSANDGLGGFVQSPVSGDEIWTTSASSVQYRNQSPGTFNGSFLRGFGGYDRTVGSTISVEGTFIFTGGYADDNNRIGLYLFGDSAVPPNEDEAGAISLIWNYDAPAGGNNPDDEITFRQGIDFAPTYSIDQPRDTTDFNVPTELFGTEITLAVDATFINDGTDDRIQLTGRLTDALGNVTTVNGTNDVLAAEFTGNYFGFVTRGRARTFITDPTGARGAPQVFDYESFTFIPEPSTFGLVAVVGGALLSFRRRLRK